MTEWNASQENIQNWIETLTAFNKTPEAGVTRQLFTPEDMEARAYIKKEMESLGLTVSQDCIGNIYAVLEGTEPELSPVWSGSHLDTVYQGGAFDGISGVVCAMEAARIIKESGLPHKRNLVVTMFSGEEPARFGMGCIGSRALAGRLTTEMTKSLHDADGVTLYDAMKQVELDPEGLSSIIKKPGDVYASVELHIEQNIYLERAGLPIGLVSSICAPSNLVVQVSGRSAHAGGMSMEERKDAFTAACEMALAVESIGRLESQSEFTTTTVGSVQVEPNQSNIIPGRVVFTIDIRDAAKASKDRIIRLITERLETIAQNRGVSVQWEIQNDDTPMPCDSHISGMMENYCKEMEIPFQRMVSGPFHDSLFLGEFVPVGMLFVPSKAGLSHCPEEWTDYKDLKQGSQILASTLMELCNEV